MAAILKEGLTILKYTDLVEIIQVQIELAANTSVNVIYNPPQKNIFHMVFAASGAQAYGNLSATFYVDGTKIFTVASTKALENTLPSGWFRGVRSTVTGIITNSDTVSHTIDFIFNGFLIHESKYDDFIKELTDKDLKNDIKEMKDDIKEMVKYLKLALPVKTMGD